MGLPSISVRRPITILMIFAGILIFGAISLSRLPVELYPNASFGVISIFIDIRGGMPPSEVETLVAKPIEEAVGTVNYLTEMISISEEGHCVIQMWFKPGIDMDLVRLEVSEKFSRVKGKLPDEIDRPVIAKYEQAQHPILIIAVAGEGYTPEQLRKIVDERIKDRLQRISGVANIEVGGGRERKILIEVDQKKIQALRLPIMQVINMLNLNNLNLLAGEIKKVKDKYLIRTMGEFGTLVDIGQIGIATTAQGSIIRVKDIAEIKDSFLEAVSYARVNKLPVVNLYIQKESLANTINVSEDINKELALIQEDLDPKIRLITTYNQAESITKAIKEVYNSMIFGAVLVALVLFVFLGHKGWIRVALVGIPVTLVCAVMFSKLPIVVFSFAIAALVLVFISLVYNPKPVAFIVFAMAVSAICTFGFMFVSGLVSKELALTINMSTLGGLILGLGMLVDNSIVVSENIMVKRREGLEMRPATVKGSEEMFLAIVVSTFTTIVVFSPIIVLRKEVPEIGILYFGLALTMVFSLIASLIVAVSLIPMLSSTLGGEASFGFDLRRIKSKYRQVLGYCMRWRWVIFCVMISLFMLCVWAFVNKLDRELFESTEVEDFTIFVELPTGAKLGVSDEIVAKVEELLAKVPEIKTKTSRVEPWSSKVYVKLVPQEQRRRSTREIIESIRPDTDKIQPAFIYFEEPQEVETNEVIIDIYGYNYEILTQLADAIASRAGAVKGLTDVKIRHRPGRPEYRVVVDKERAAALGLNMEEVANVLHAQMRGLRATLYHTEGKEIEVVVRLAPKYRKTLEDLRRLTFTLPNGEQIYLEQIVKIEQGLSPSKVWRKNKVRMIQVSANKGVHALGKAVELIREAIKDIKFPEDYFYRFGGNYDRMVEVQAAYAIAFVGAIIFVYLVLAALFESFLQPLIIMVSLPMTFIGVIVFLRLRNTPVSMSVSMGMIVLAGVVVNNAIIMVDHFNRLKSLGCSKYRMLIAGGADRLRPILMTTMTTVLGFMPLALSRSTEIKSLSRMAKVLIVGLSFSTVVTLLFLPSIYLVCEDIKAFIIRLQKHTKPVPETENA
ncbi:MAG: efflux RND transporter permease subunit [Candidatus Omnitrophota bacterium]